MNGWARHQHNSGTYYTKSVALGMLRVFQGHDRRWAAYLSTPSIPLTSGHMTAEAAAGAAETRLVHDADRTIEQLTERKEQVS